jgi:hypothetical protein
MNESVGLESPEISVANSNELSTQVDDFFHAPGGRVYEFLQKQLHLYRNDIRLQDYFTMLQLDMAEKSHINLRQRASHRVLDWAIRRADQVSGYRRRETIKADVLFCPMVNFTRKTENQFLIRTLLGLSQTDAKIVCLLPFDAPCKPELEARLLAAGRTGQVRFVDPLGSSSSIEGRLRSKAARVRAREAFQKTSDILVQHGLAPPSGTADQFDHIALFAEAWERLASSIDFDTVVARCHWHPLCGPVCRTGLERAKPVITFQQGVIGHTLDTPVTASTYVAFGPSSASFLKRLNRAFFERAKMPEPERKYVSGGSLYDDIVSLPDQFELQTLLMVDIPQPRGQSEFYGVECQCKALLQLADNLLTARPSLRLIIRPHPFWGDLDLQACQRLAREHQFRCELSHPAWSLVDDLRRSSVAVGIFSGALTVASACGLPTIFLQTEQGYTTGDLACFAHGQNLLPDAAFEKINNILADRPAYEDARNEALRNARDYYADGGNVVLDGAFFERLLQN